MNAKISINEEYLVIGGVRFLHKQARDNCRCDSCWNSDLQQRRANPPTDAIKVIDCQLKEESAGSIARVTWSDSHQGWLQLTPDAGISCKTTAEELRTGELILWKQPLDSSSYRFDFSEVLCSAKERYNLLQTFMRTGIVQICNSPLKDHENPGLVDIAEKIGLGPPVNTLFGPFFNVKSKPSSSQLKNQAYTNLPLPLHTDLPFYDTPPEVFLFGCVSPSLAGGESVYTDGFAAALHLKEYHPAFFKTLCTVPMIHRDDTAAWQMVSMQPLIQLHDDGSIRRIVDNPTCRDSSQYWNPPAMWFEAYGAYRAIVEDTSRHFVYPMVAGDITIFDNFRLYHGRNGFPDSSDDDQQSLRARFMTGLYCTRTHLNSAVRMLEAELEIN